MDNYTPGYILDKYNEKINSVGYKLKQAIGHPEEQMRLLMQLKIYINSMINDLAQMRDVAFQYKSFEFQDITQLYNLTYGILSSITSVISGMTIDVVGSDTEVVLTKDDTKDAVIQKFKLMLGGIDKVMRYLMTLNKPVRESYNEENPEMDAVNETTTFFDELCIAEEASTSYKIMRKMQTNKLALAKQLSDHKKLCQKKYTECHGQTDLEETFRNWLNKQKAMVQRKINGKEIKNKKDLQKFINLYDSYLNKLGSSANESSLYEDLGICAESYGQGSEHKLQGQKERHKLTSLNSDINHLSRYIKTQLSECKTIADKKKLKEKIESKKEKYENEIYNFDSEFPEDEYSPSFRAQCKNKLEKLVDICNKAL